MLTACSHRILREVEYYQSTQFNDSSLHKDKVMAKLQKVNKKIIRNNSADTFWIINYFSVSKNIYDALYLSNKDTLYAETKGHRVCFDQSNKAVQGSQDIIDFIFKGTELPRVLDGTVQTMAQRIIILNHDSIKITGFNLNNGNEMIKKFK